MLVLGLLACEPEPSEPPDEPLCAEGEVQEGLRCLPEHCGVGVWGKLPLDPEALYVDPMAPEGGNGSWEHPFQELTPLVEVGGTIYLAEGTYVGTLLDDGPDMRVQGRCKELVNLAPPETDAPFFTVVGMRTLPQVTWHLSDLTIRGGRPGVEIVGGHLILERVDLIDAEDVALHVEDIVELREVTIRGISPGAAGDSIGIWASGIAVLVGNDVLMEDFDGVGIAVSMATVEMDRLTLRDVGAAAGLPSVGVTVEWDARFTCRDCLIEDIANIGVQSVGGSWLELMDTTIRGVHPLKNHAAVGVTTELEANTLLRRVHIEEVQGYGARAVGPGAHLILEEVEISEVRSVEGSPGLGVLIEAGASLEGDHLHLHDIEGAGLVCEDSTMTLEGAQIRSIPAGMEVGDRGYLAGPGALLSDGCQATLRDWSIEDATIFGLVVQGDETLVELDGLFVDGTVGVEPARPVDVVVQGGGTLFLTDATLQGQEHGLIVAAGQASVGGLVLPPSDGVGLVVQEEGLLEVDDALVQGRVGWGVGAALSSTLVLTDSRIEDTRRDENRSLSTALAVDDSSALVLGVDILRTEGIGVACEAGCTLEMEACPVQDSELAGVFVGPGGQALLTDVSVSGVLKENTVGLGVGVAVVQGELLMLGGGSEGASHAAAWVDEGSASFEEVILTGGPRQEVLDTLVHGDALVVIEGQVDLSECTLQQAQGHGLVLHGSQASLDQVDFVDNRVDLLQQACLDEVLEPQPEWSVDTCPSYEEPLLPLDFFNAVDLGRATD